MWNVPQPIRRLNHRLTANQVMAPQVPERPLKFHAEDISEEIVNLSLQEISASFSLPAYTAFFFFFCLRQVSDETGGNCISPHAKEMFPLSPT